MKIYKDNEALLSRLEEIKREKLKILLQEHTSSLVETVGHTNSDIGKAINDLKLKKRLEEKIIREDFFINNNQVPLHCFKLQ